MSSLQQICTSCDRLAETRCPRCEQPLCAVHEVPAHRSHCGFCQLAVDARVRSRLAGRITVAASAAVAGMVGGALIIMLAASALGISSEFIILMMLVAELGCGALSAYAADQKMQHWLRKRAETELGQLPEARLLPGRND